MNEILEDISVRNKTLSVLLPAEIDEHISSILRMELDRQISTKRIERIVFDFARTEWMDSSGLGMILGRYKKMQFVKGCIRAIHVNQRIASVMRMAGLHKVISINEGEEA